MPTICVDFDGVIHAYSKGWNDGTIYDSPLPGAFDGLHALMQYAAVVIHTTRDPQQVADWLFERGTFNITWEEPGARVCEFWNDQTRLFVTNRKLPALAYLDDRAVRFTSWRTAVDETLLAAGLHPEPHLAARPAMNREEQGAPTDWQAIARQREHELKTAGEGRHQAEQERDGAYRERAQLLAWLAALHPAVIAPALDLDEPGWWILYLTPATGGQMSWHIAPRDAGLFAHVERVEPEDPRAQWDGHTTPEKYQRIAALTATAAGNG